MNNLTPQLVLTRGVSQVLPDTAGLLALMQERKIKLYLGIDPTGSLLTLGHSVVLRKLQQFAQLGHDVILLIGNGTVRIGDPTGKDTTRPVLTDEQIAENFSTWKEQASTILDFSQIRLLRNGDWLDELTYADMVKLLAKTTVQQLLERDMFQERIKQQLPIHGHEILYPMLQGYDSVAMDVDLEIGGTDQLFNMMMGRTLQQIYNNRQKWVLTTPLINGTDGRKMSKSYGNFIALTESARNMYGKLMSLADEMIIEYFLLLTDVPQEKIDHYQDQLDSGTNPIVIKKALAHTITQQYHGSAKAEEAAAFFQKTVQDKQIPQDIPVVTVTSDSLQLLEIIKLCLPQESNSNIRRLIEQRAVEVLPEGLRPQDPYSNLEIKSETVLRVGKRRYFKLELGS